MTCHSFADRPFTVRDAMPFETTGGPLCSWMTNPVRCNGESGSALPGGGFDGSGDFKSQLDVFSKSEKWLTPAPIPDLRSGLEEKEKSQDLQIM